MEAEKLTQHQLHLQAAEIKQVLVILEGHLQRIEQELQEVEKQVKAFMEQLAYEQQKELKELHQLKYKETFTIWLTKWNKLQKKKRN